MGYRSDVSYLILFPDEAQYHTFLTTARTLSNQPIVNDVIVSINGQNQWGDMAHALDQTVHGVNMYKEECVKWYESYTDVHSHESLIALAKIGAEQVVTPYPIGTNTTQHMTPCTYNFFRVGEGDEDVERRENGVHVALSMDPMRMDRSIYYREPMRAMFDKKDV